VQSDELPTASQRDRLVARPQPVRSAISRPGTIQAEAS
jgi:hypothetical protein